MLLLLLSSPALAEPGYSASDKDLAIVGTVAVVLSLLCFAVGGGLVALVARALQASKPWVIVSGCIFGSLAAYAGWASMFIPSAALIVALVLAGRTM